MESVANQEWIKEMANGKWLRGGKGKGMESALWLSKGKGVPGRGDKLAATPRR